MFGRLTYLLNNSVLHSLSDIWASFYSIFGYIAHYIFLNESKRHLQISSQIKAKQFLEIPYNINNEIMKNYKILEDVSCLECGDVIPYKRSNKKFCCEKCKNTYNNKKIRNARISKLRILNALDKNYKILSNLIKSEMSSLDIMQAKQLGFDFTYVTSYHKLRKGNEFFCFDIRFKISQSRLYSICRLPINIENGSLLKKKL